MFPDRIKIGTMYNALCFDFSSLDIEISSRFWKWNNDWGEPAVSYR
jgi:hypothetical protein